MVMHAHAEPRHPIRHPFTLILLSVAVLLLIATGVMTGLYVTKGSTDFTHVFEQAPANVADTLECPDDPDRWWAATGGPTNKCIFSGNRLLPRAVSEAKVQAKCAAMTSCAGYMKRVVGSYQGVTGCTAPHTDGLIKPYNYGQPEYMLYGKGALSTLASVSPATQGVHHEVVTVTMRRNA